MSICQEHKDSGFAFPEPCPFCLVDENERLKVFIECEVEGMGVSSFRRALVCLGDIMPELRELCMVDRVCGVNPGRRLRKEKAASNGKVPNGSRGFVRLSGGVYGSD